MFALRTQTVTIGWTSNMAPTTTGSVTMHVYLVPRMSSSVSDEWSTDPYPRGRGQDRITARREDRLGPVLDLRGDLDERHRTRTEDRAHDETVHLPMDHADRPEHRHRLAVGEQLPDVLDAGAMAPPGATGPVQHQRDDDEAAR